MGGMNACSASFPPNIDRVVHHLEHLVQPNVELHHMEQGSASHQARWCITPSTWCIASDQKDCWRAQ
eukprot:1149435-Pelagomonas_calceolata.AAC.9